MATRLIRTCYFYRHCSCSLCCIAGPRATMTQQSVPYAVIDRLLFSVSSLGRGENFTSYLRAHSGTAARYSMAMTSISSQNPHPHLSLSHPSPTCELFFPVFSLCLYHSLRTCRLVPTYCFCLAASIQHVVPHHLFCPLLYPRRFLHGNRRLHRLHLVPFSRGLGRL